MGSLRGKTSVSFFVLVRVPLVVLSNRRGLSKSHFLILGECGFEGSRCW
jgi:hypothetical protein